MQTTDTVVVTVNQTATLSVTAIGAGTVTLDPAGGSYPAGASVTVTATPAAGAVFDGFSDSLTGTASPQALQVHADEAVQAQFRGAAGSPSTGCGIGPELAAALPVLAWLRRRRRPSLPTSAGQRGLLAP